MSDVAQIDGLPAPATSRGSAPVLNRFSASPAKTRRPTPPLRVLHRPNARCETRGARGYLVRPQLFNAPVTQWIRVPAYEAGSRRFKSFRARHLSRAVSALVLQHHDERKPRLDRDDAELLARVVGIALRRRVGRDGGLMLIEFIGVGDSRLHHARNRVHLTG